MQFDGVLAQPLSEIPPSSIPVAQDLYLPLQRVQQVCSRVFSVLQKPSHLHFLILE
jgi:hypothetical protein